MRCDLATGVAASREAVAGAADISDMPSSPALPPESLVLVWSEEYGLYFEADDPRPELDGRHSFTVEEAESVADEDGVVIQGGPAEGAV